MAKPKLVQWNGGWLSILV